MISTSRGWQYRGPPLPPLPSASTIPSGSTGRRPVEARHGLGVRNDQAERPSGPHYPGVGHAIVAAKLGTPVERVWVAGTRGRTEYGARDFGKDFRRRDVTRLAILAAGRIATDRAGLSADDGQDWADA